MRVPTVHLNGSGLEDLLAKALGAARALSAAVEAVGAAAPHGRDFYPQGPDAEGEALAWHRRRMGVLRELVADAEAQVDHLRKEKEVREARRR